MFRVPADAVDLRVPREYVLPRGWQAFAIVCLLPLWWLIGASFFMWPMIHNWFVRDTSISRWHTVVVTGTPAARGTSSTNALGIMPVS